MASITTNRRSKTAKDESTCTWIVASALMGEYSRPRYATKATIVPTETVPWIAIVIYTIAPKSPSQAEPPGFVYGIIASLFVLFNIFALNQWLQYRAKGRWADYLFGEKGYIVLSLTAKSALAWQIFGGTLAG